MLKKTILHLSNAIFFYLVILVASLCGGEPRPRRKAGVSPRDAHACKEHLYLSRLPFCFCTHRNFFLCELFQKSNRHFFVEELFCFSFRFRNLNVEFIVLICFLLWTAIFAISSFMYTVLTQRIL